MLDFIKTIVNALKIYVDEKFVSSRPDWNQNDESAENYIENRPFYENKTLILEALFINGGQDADYIKDGNICQKFINMCQIYSFVYFSIDGNDIVKLYISKDGNTYYLKNEDKKTYFWTYSRYNEVYAAIEVSDDSHVGKPVYFYSDYQLKTIDEKYIPDTITEDIKTVQTVAETNANNLSKEIDNRKDADELKMDKSDPTGTGSFSINRQENSVIGQHSVALGYNVIADKPNMSAFGVYNSTEPYYTETIQYDYLRMDEYVNPYINVAMSDSYYVENGMYILNNPSYRVALQYVPVGYYFMTSWTGGSASGGVSEKNIMYKAKSVYDNNEDSIIVDIYEIVEKDYIEVIGNGASDEERSNAYTLDWAGNGCFAGDVYVGGANMESGTKVLTGKSIATDEDVLSFLSEMDLATPVSTSDGTIFISNDGAYFII